jgi:hypothetical protein
MKKTLLISLLTLLGFAAFPQITILAESAPLEEDLEDAKIKLLPLKNGNTAFIEFIGKKGFRIRIFNPAHKQIADREIEASYGKMSMYGFIDGIFSVEDQIIVFVSDVVRASTFKAYFALFRIVINGTNGAVIKDEQIAKLTEFGASGETAFKKGFLDQPGFYVRKDPNSDNYAIAHFDSFESDRNKRLKLTHYDARHSVLNEGYFLSLNDEYKYVSFMDMAIVGDSKLFVSASIYNTKENKVKYISVGCLDKETKTFNQKILEFTKNKTVTSARLLFDQERDQLLMISNILGTIKDESKFMGKDKTTGYYSSDITVIDPKSLSIKFEKGLSPPALTKDFQNKVTKKGPFTGTLQGFHINEDNTYTAVFEESSSVITGSSIITVTTFLGPFGISILNDKFQETETYLIPFSASVQGGYGQTWSPNKNFSGPMYLNGEDHFKEPAYFNAGSKKFFLLNDIEENEAKLKQGKIELIGGLGSADGYRYIFADGKQTRDKLIRTQEKQHAFGIYNDATYNSKTGELITIVRSNKKGWKNQIVWMSVK